MTENIKNILKLLQKQRGFDFSGYRTSMLERRLDKRLLSTKCENHADYYQYLLIHPEEIDALVDVFTINVSWFFRNPIVFEYLDKFVIPNITSSKQEEKNCSLRVWSAGCSCGEEPYSITILLNEHLKKENAKFDLNIFATDINTTALKRAAAGIYDHDSIANVKFGIFTHYFTEYMRKYKIENNLKKMVRFSLYDMLNKKHKVPPDSIFGSFDIVFCRNLLIYFEPEYQKIIFNKLYNSLNKNGYLILGESEVPCEEFKQKFKRENKCSKIYRKIK